jgi:catecholate siderophore receptor
MIITVGFLAITSASSLAVRPVVAQQAADTTATIAFTIPALPLRAALDSFARQSGVTVNWDRPADDARSTEVIGRYPAARALRLLLTGSGFAARFTSPRSASLEPAVQRLANVEVIGHARRATTYAAPVTSSATKTPTPLRDVPQSVTVVTRSLIADQAMQSMADVARYLPGVTMGHGEGNRDQPTIRGNGTTANFFLDGVRDDVQYFRDLYNVERVEALKGASALIFGRGTGGGVINRVAKEASWTPVRDATFQGGSHENRRATVDIGQGLTDAVAFRINGLYENSNQFRRDVGVERWGLNPTVRLNAGPGTTVTTGYEHFEDYRTADRGIPSFRGLPAPTDVHTFFGDPRASHASVRVDALSAAVEHQAGRVTLRNRTRYADYDKFYQNVFPGAVDSAGAEVSLSAYNNATARRNFFNQSDLILHTSTGPFDHTVLAGIEVGRQVSDNFRNTGYFDDTATSITAPFDHPTVSPAVTFRQGATDADNHTAVSTLSFYAQDQLVLSRHWQLVAGLRYERFDVDFHNNRTNQDLTRRDDLISPRVGLLFKPLGRLSMYGSVSVSALPSSGDQFSSLTATTETLEPERFTNYEIGAKWDLREDLALTAAAYRLDRTNTTAPDPQDPTRLVQTGSQRTKGIELGVTGNLTPIWQVAGGYANQDAYVTSRTAAAPPGARVPLVPRQTLSLWNRVQVAPRIGLGLGIVHQARMFAAIDDAVTLPAFTRLDLGAFATLTSRLRLQLNVENLFDRRYFATANGNNNISPGAPRSFRASLTAGF